MSIVLEKLFLNKNPLFTRDQAITESARCLNCFDAPCTKACPTNIDVAKFINQIYNDNIRGSANTILIDNILGYSCGRVCPVEVLCESACVYHFAGKDPIKIGKLQEYSIKTAVNRVGFVSLFHIKKYH